jgi:hypothetical protein
MPQVRRSATSAVWVPCSPTPDRPPATIAFREPYSPILANNSASSVRRALCSQIQGSPVAPRAALARLLLRPEVPCAPSACRARRSRNRGASRANHASRAPSPEVQEAPPVLNALLDRSPQARVVQPVPSAMRERRNRTPAALVASPAQLVPHLRQAAPSAASARREPLTRAKARSAPSARQEPLPLALAVPPARPARLEPPNHRLAARVAARVQRIPIHPRAARPAVALVAAMEAAPAIPVPRMRQSSARGVMARQVSAARRSTRVLSRATAPRSARRRKRRKSSGHPDDA